MQPVPLKTGLKCIDNLCRPRSARSRKEVGVVGQASFASSVINLVNTSESRAQQQNQGTIHAHKEQLSVLVSSQCLSPCPAWASSSEWS